MSKTRCDLQCCSCQEHSYDQTRLMMKRHAHSSNYRECSPFHQYTPTDTIGQGAFGKIVRVRRQHDGAEKQLVWKEMNLSNMSSVGRHQVMAEARTLRALQRHPNIVKFYDTFTNENSVYIVMEYCPGGDLAQLIESVRNCDMQSTRRGDGTTYIHEKTIWRLLGQITSALVACHWNHDDATGVHRPILHRDLKPANVLLDQYGNAKLADFGLSTDEPLPVVHERMTENSQGASVFMMGTPCYMSPERINGCPYDERSDIWSLGCLLYELMALRPPFMGKAHHELFACINSRSSPRPPSRYSDHLRRMCTWMLRKDQSRRPRIENVVRRIPHFRTAEEQPVRRRPSVYLCVPQEAPTKSAVSHSEQKQVLHKPYDAVSYNQQQHAVGRERIPLVPKQLYYSHNYGPQQNNRVENDDPRVVSCEQYARPLSGRWGGMDYRNQHHHVPQQQSCQVPHHHYAQGAQASSPNRSIQDSDTKMLGKRIRISAIETLASSGHIHKRRRTGEAESPTVKSESPDGIFVGA